MNITCLQCNTSVEVRTSEVKRGFGKFCSRSCSALYNNSKKRAAVESNLTCAKCKKDFYRSPSKLKTSKSGLYFCSRLCKDAAQKLVGGIKAIQPEQYDSPSEYRAKVERERGIKECDRCKYNKYPQILEVHHKDRDTENNDLENLEVLCPTCHREEHYEGRDGIFTRNFKIN